MRLLPIACLLAVFSLAGCAYENPAEPSAAAPDLSVPFRVTIGASPGSGAQSGTAVVTAHVQNANGAALANVVVSFTTNRGNIAPSQVTTDAGGTATATLVATDTADVTAASGALTARTIVTFQAPTPTPAPTPAPSPTPSPAPPLPTVFVNVSSSATSGVPLTFGVSSSATGVVWNWSFGDDSAPLSTSAFSTTHTYAKAGTYTATVSSSQTSPASATITVSDPVIPTAPSGFTATMTCATPGPVATAMACNVSATYNGATLQSSEIKNVDWDWGDGRTDLNLTVPVNTHKYDQTGSFTVFAVVTASTQIGAVRGSPVASKLIIINP